MTVALPVSGDLFAQGSAQQRFYDEIAARNDYIKGLMHYEFGEYDQALELLNKAYLKIPGESALSYTMASVYQKLGEYQKASLFARQAVEYDRSNKWYRLKLAEIYSQTGQDDASLKVLNELIQLNPKDMQALSALAAAQSSQKKYKEANTTLNKMLKAGGDSWTVYYEKFQNFNQMENMRDSSIAMLRKMQELEPENLITLQILSRFYADSDDNENAKSVLLNALDKNQRDPETLLLLADVYISEAKWDSAGALVTAFVGDTLINPIEKLPFVDHLLQVYRQDTSNATLGAVMRDIVDAYTDAHPDYAPAHTYAAELYIELGDTDRALEALGKTVDLMPENEVAWQERIRLLLQEDRVQEAIQAGVEADTFVPDNPFVQFLLGNAYYMNKQHSEAAAWLKRAADLPARGEFKSAIHTTLGDSYNAMNDFAHADEAFEKALELNPQNDIALNNYAYSLSNRGEAHLLEKALSMAERALKTDENSASYLDTIGWIHFKMGNYQKAKQFLARSLEENPESAEVLEHMGDVLEKLNDKQAVEYWKRALELEPERTHLSERIR